MTCTVRCTLSPGRWSSLIVDSSTHLTLYRKEVPGRLAITPERRLREKQLLSWGRVHVVYERSTSYQSSSMDNNMDNNTKYYQSMHTILVVIIILLYRELVVCIELQIIVRGGGWRGGASNGEEAHDAEYYQQQSMHTSYQLLILYQQYLAVGNSRVTDLRYSYFVVLATRVYRSYASYRLVYTTLVLQSICTKYITSSYAYYYCMHTLAGVFNMHTKY